MERSEINKKLEAIEVTKGLLDHEQWIEMSMSMISSIVASLKTTRVVSPSRVKTRKRGRRATTRAKLHKVMAKKGLTQKQFAEKYNVSRATVSAVSSGKIKKSGTIEAVLKRV